MFQSRNPWPSETIWLWLSVALFAAVVLTTRIPFYADYYLPEIQPDTWSYVKLALSIRDGESPSFAKRPPGYPLFLWLTTSVHPSWAAVLLAQSGLCLVVGTTTIWAAYRARAYLALTVSLAAALFVTSGTNLASETSIMSEPLYSYSLMAGFTCLWVGLRDRSTRWLVAAGATFGLTIWTRPAGMFLIVIAIATCLFMVRNRYRRSAQVAFLLPMLTLLLVLGGYNLQKDDVLSLSPRGPANIAAATAMFWEEDPSFSVETNHAIRRMKGQASARDQRILHTSWNLKDLYFTFKKNYSYTKHVKEFAFKHWLSSRSGSIAVEKEYFDTLGRVAWKAVKAHPDLYAKFVLSNLYGYFLYNPKADLNFWDQRLALRWRAWATGVPDEGKVERLVKAGSSADLLHRPKGVQSNGQFTPEPSTGLSWVRSVDKIQRTVSASAIWLLAFAVVSVLSLIRLIQTRARDVDSFFVMLFCAAGFGAALLVSLVETALVRYSFPTTFLVYFPIALSPLLFTPRAS